MTQTVLITLTSAGTDTGPFNLYSNLDGFTTPFDTGVTRTDLLLGYVCNTVPDAASTVRVKSSGALCQNYVDLLLPSATTTTTSTSSTTTTTTTSASLPIYSLVNNSTNIISGVTLSDGAVLVGGTFPLNPGQSTSGYISPAGIYNIEIYGLKGISDEIKCTFRGSNLAAQCDYNDETEGGTFNLNGFSVRCLDEQIGFSVDVLMTVEDGVC